MSQPWLCLSLKRKKPGVLEKGQVNGPKPRVTHEEPAPEPSPALVSTSIDMENSILIQEDDGRLTVFTVSMFSSYSTGYYTFV